MYFFFKLLIGKNIILPPPINKFGSEIGLIFIPDENIDNFNYVGITSGLQNETDYRLYIGIPEFIENDPNIFEFNDKLIEIFKEFELIGYKTNKSKTFMAGHGKGGFLMQLWTGINANNYTNIYPFNYGGQILLSSFIQRIFRNNNSQLLNYTNYSIPTLSLSGELDGICRITRIIEQFYIQNNKQINEFSNNFIINYPVIIIYGMNHIQVTDITDIYSMPLTIFNNDFQPEISYKSAHNQIISVITSFMNISKNNINIIPIMINNSLLLAKSFINALNLEGFYHFKLPCNCINNTCDEQWNCASGSNWTNLNAQQTMCSFSELSNNGSNIRIINRDSFHPTWQNKPQVHYAWILNNCSSPTQINCILNTLTVTQNIYNYKQEYIPILNDNGFEPISATWMRTKINSKQRCYQHINYKGYVKEEWNKCEILNKKSVNYGINNIINKNTLNRYNYYGLPLQIGTDIYEFGGP
eukprot:465038_1